MNKKYIYAILVVILLVGGYFYFQKPKIVPMVLVNDQKDSEGQINVGKVVSPKDAWLVIQTNEDGVPGPVVGYTKIKAGENNDVKVKIDKSNVTPTLHAMIHEDDGTKEKFDFPENDSPMMYKMEMVTKIFKLN